MVSDLRVNEFVPQSFQGRQRAALIAAHQAGVADDIRRHDRGQPALLARQGTIPRHSCARSVEATRKPGKRPPTWRASDGQWGDRPHFWLPRGGPDIMLVYCIPTASREAVMIGRRACLALFLVG